MFFFRYPLNRLASRPLFLLYQNTTLLQNSEINENTNCVSFLGWVCRPQVEWKMLEVLEAVRKSKLSSRSSCRSRWQSQSKLKQTTCLCSRKNFSAKKNVVKYRLDAANSNPEISQSESQEAGIWLDMWTSMWETSVVFWRRIWNTCWIRHFRGNSN